MRFGSLFAGIGGFDLGLSRAGMVPVWQVEIDPWCRRVLAKHWPDVQRFEDVRNVGREQLAAVDLICGGWPCQPFSVAGKRRGKEDDRHLWPEVRRIIAECRPRWFLGENVLGIVSMELDTVLSDLESEGYTAWTFIIPACGVDAPHRRNRVWIVAHADKESDIDDKREHGRPSQTTSAESGERIPTWGGRWLVSRSIDRRIRWLPDAGTDRTVTRIPYGMDRIGALGNAVVPQVVEQIGRFIMEANRP